MHAPALPFFGGIDFDRGRLFDTTDLDEARQRCARVLNPHTLRVLGREARLHSRMDHLRLGPLSLSRLTWGTAVEVDPDRLGCYYLLSLPLRGHAAFEHVDGRTEVSPACAGLVSSAPRFRFRTSADFEQLVVRFERAAVDEAWQALAGSAPPQAIDFACGVPLGGAAWQAIEPALRLLAACARGELDAQRLRHLTARVQDLLLTTLLLQQPSSLGLRPAAVPRALPLHVRRAEGFMREHLDEPLTLARVALACGVSRRTLQAGFQRVHGFGPMQWLRAQRLHAVRDALRAEAAARPSVTGIALRFGFTHLGEFSAAYRRAFGETPSGTLRRR